MNVPFEVSRTLSLSAIKKWEVLGRESIRGNWDFTCEEGLWRRSQDEQNRVFSSWQDTFDVRRRIVHFKNQYAVINKVLELKQTYLWVHYLLPADEIQEQADVIEQGLHFGGWQQVHESLFRLGDLQCEISRGKRHPEDEKVGRIVPADYEYLECSIYTSNDFKEGLAKKPWDVLNTGFRDHGTRSDTVNSITAHDLPSLFPAQLEIGCGPSIEAGVPPLHRLHEMYNITRKDGSYILHGPDDVLLAEVLRHPETKYIELTEMYRAILNAKNTPFYEILAELYRGGYFVGDVITNNVDCIVPYLGLPQKFIRRFEESYFNPEIDFHKDAKSLWVVGVHADRRKVQELARRKGLVVVHVDPEGYADSSGTFTPYPVESYEKDDYFLQKTASVAFQDIHSALLDNSVPIPHSGAPVLSRTQHVKGEFFGNQFQIEPSLQEKINTHWSEQLASGKSLHRGDVLTVARVTQQGNDLLLTIERTDYAHYLYSQKYELPVAHACHSIHTSVLVISNDGFAVLGIMSDKTSVPNMIQFPGGGLDMTDIKDHIVDFECNARRELLEEIGIDANNDNFVDRFEQFCIKTGGGRGTVGVIFVAYCSLGRDAILRLFDQRGDKEEFSQLVFVPLSTKGIDVFEDTYKDTPKEEKVLPTLREFVDCG